MNAVISHDECTEIVRRFYRAYTAHVRRFYGALCFLKRSYCDLRHCHADHCALKANLLRSFEIAEYGRVESLLKITQELRPTLYLHQF
jgi:hypothetical protein